MTTASMRMVGYAIVVLLQLLHIGLDCCSIIYQFYARTFLQKSTQKRDGPNPHLWLWCIEHIVPHHVHQTDSFA